MGIRGSGECCLSMFSSSNSSNSFISNSNSNNNRNSSNNICRATATTATTAAERPPPQQFQNQKWGDRGGDPYQQQQQQQQQQQGNYNNPPASAQPSSNLNQTYYNPMSPGGPNSNNNYPMSARPTPSSRPSPNNNNAPMSAPATAIYNNVDYIDPQHPATTVTAKNSCPNVDRVPLNPPLLSNATRTTSVSNARPRIAHATTILEGGEGTGGVERRNQARQEQLREYHERERREREMNGPPIPPQVESDDDDEEEYGRTQNPVPLHVQNKVPAKPAMKKPGTSVLAKKRASAQRVSIVQFNHSKTSLGRNKPKPTPTHHHQPPVYTDDNDFQELYSVATEKDDLDDDDLSTKKSTVHPHVSPSHSVVTLPLHHQHLKLLQRTV
ncbi:hypothetical protein BC829DRAFT_207601 [Chytridium lagenaria]|nr:hypothetical protein BC829DRAFT_207601 [Chytridium lagenaria]